MAGRPEIRGLPHFILGQSMGGAVALKVHLKEPREWDGVVLVSPMCKVTPSSLLTDAYSTPFNWLTCWTPIFILMALCWTK